MFGGVGVRAVAVRWTGIFHSQMDMMGLFGYGEAGHEGDEHRKRPFFDCFAFATRDM